MKREDTWLHPERKRGVLNNSPRWIGSNAFSLLMTRDYRECSRRDRLECR